MTGRPANDNGDFDPYHGGEVVPLLLVIPESVAQLVGAEREDGAEGVNARGPLAKRPIVPLENSPLVMVERIDPEAKGVHLCLIHHHQKKHPHKGVGVLAVGR